MSQRITIVERHPGESAHLYRIVRHQVVATCPYEMPVDIAGCTDIESVKAAWRLLVPDQIYPR